jgi:CheY-like chemotaxis protein
VNPQFKARISQELVNLNSIFGQNTAKVRELVNAFIQKTPAQLDAISNHLQSDNFSEAAKTIHKVKVRYGYFGLHDLMADFEIWEDMLKKEERVLNHAEVMAYVKRKTNLIIEELKQSEYFQEEEAFQRPLPLAGKLVLIAEDDEVNAMVFDLFIKETGADTVLATDGMQALSFAKEGKPDLIFMDVHMPFFSGLDAIKELRSLGFKRPIISLSASTRLNEKENSMSAGATDFLVKPVNRDAINSILFRYLS